MILFRKIRNILLVLSLSAVNILHAQSLQTPIPQNQMQVYALLQMDCGTNGQLNDFTVEITRLSVDQPKLFIRTLREGLPEELRAKIREQAVEKFNRRQAWIKNEASDLFDEQTVLSLAQASQQDYVADAVRNADLRFRENSVRALGVVGDRQAVNLIKAAVNKEPALAVLAKQAINSIRSRAKGK